MFTSIYNHPIYNHRQKISSMIKQKNYRMYMFWRRKIESGNWASG